MCVYLIWAKGTRLYKIGVSRNPEERIKTLQGSSPHHLVLLHSFKTQFAEKAETAIHKGFGLDKKVTPGEWFELSEDEVAYFLNIQDHTQVTFLDQPSLLDPPPVIHL
jgi:hypothetical protein